MSQLLFAIVIAITGLAIIVAVHGYQTEGALRDIADAIREQTEAMKDEPK